MYREKTFSILLLGFLSLSACTSPNQTFIDQPQNNEVAEKLIEVFDKSGIISEEEINTTVYNAVKDAVVGVNTTTLKRNFIRFVPVKGTGSGVVISQNGYILTNYHVVEDADKLQVELSDQSVWDAELIGGDINNDIAIIKVNAPSNRLKTARLGNSDEINVGQRVLAIGNPFGLSGTLTTGIISSLNRSLSSEDGTVLKNIMQTDAAINPGNSGGPLLNSRGEIIGINTAIFSTTGGNIGIGFAIPINAVKQVIRNIETGLTGNIVS